MISDKIKNLRIEHKISQEKLAEKLNVSRQSISLWENGQATPSIENMIAIAAIFDVSIDTLLRDKEENHLEENIMETRKKRERRNGV